MLTDMEDIMHHVYMKSCLKQLEGTDKKFPCTRGTTDYYYLNILKWFSSGWGWERDLRVLPDKLACYIMHRFLYVALLAKTCLN